jgi:hypothetical protein
MASDRETDDPRENLVLGQENVRKIRFPEGVGGG